MTIVTLAQMLLEALWKYVTANIVIKGSHDESHLTIGALRILKSCGTR
jgi:hypothetical protein